MRSELNPEQQAAVDHGDGPLLVVAGAGTGKTAVITRRIARLVESGQAPAAKILALTFTDKAAREMSDRLYELIGWQAISVQIMTYNAFGAELLNRFASHIGRNVSGGLINDMQKSLLLQQQLTSISWHYYGIQPDPYGFAAKLVDYIGRLQNAGVTPSAYTGYVGRLAAEPGECHPAEVAEQQDLAAVYEAYEAIKMATGTFDYYDQVALPVDILQQRPNLATRLRQEYHYVLVDEYQDTSPTQDSLLRLMVPPGGNIFAVGDDDQAIYGFRGSDVANILGFAEHFKVARPLALKQNYRSGQPILDAAYRLIRHNDPERLEAQLGLDKQLQAQTNAAKVLFTAHQSVAAEQAAIIVAIQQRLAAGEPARQIAILARGKATLRSYAKNLRDVAVPFALSADVNIFEQPEVIGLWHLLSWVGQQADDETIAHVMLGPLMGWRSAAWRAVVERAATDDCGAETALRLLAAEGGAEATAVVAALDDWRERAALTTITELTYYLAAEAISPVSGLSLFARLEARATEAAGRHQARVMRVFADLQRLLQQMDDFATAQELARGDRNLAAYLKQFPRPPALEVSETLGDADGVQLLTVHAAKGLEFDTVYVVNCSLRAWTDQPDRGLSVPEALDSRADLPPVHEQRRLMYVALTRARRELHLSSAIATTGGQRQAVSPLVAEALGEASSLATASTPEPSIKILLNSLQRYYPLQEEMPERLPFETADGWITLGIGDIGRYHDSPHDFYLEKVLGVSRPTGPQLAFGTAIHGVIQAWYESQLADRPATVAELLQRLDELWRNQGYSSAAAAEQALERARRGIQAFVQRESGNTDLAIKSTEQPIRFELPEAKLRLRGRIDATFMTPDGLQVRDFKTGVRRDADKLADEAKKSLQLRSYALALEQITGAAPATVALDYVMSGVVGTASLTDRVLKLHRAKLAELADRLRARDFDPGAPSDFNRAAAFRYYGTEREENPS